jgi:hypothetical protein
MNKPKIFSFVVVLAATAALFVIVVAGLASSNPTTVRENVSLNQGWDTVFFEDFESGIDSNVWTASDQNGTTGGEYYWATTTYTASQGSNSAWIAGGGEDGALLEAGADNYPDSTLSSLLREPVDLTDPTNARLTFDYWIKTEPNFDVFQVAVSTDGSNFDDVWNQSGGDGEWLSAEVSLSDYVGESTVWVHFFFSSNASENDIGVFLDNVRLESLTETKTYFPLVRRDPTPTPPPFYYFDDFSDPSSGWPVIDNSWNSQDCFKWYYSGAETYFGDICDDRTDVKVSPLVDLPEGDYELSVSARFRSTGESADIMWWTSYGILFDAKDDPNPSNPDLGDYYMIWVLWEGNDYFKWKILKDIPGDQLNLTEWERLDPSYFDYGNGGTKFNHWKIVRTDTTISVYVNDFPLKTINEARPTENYQTLFGVFNSTYETSFNEVAFDNYEVQALDGSTAIDWLPGKEGNAVISGEFSLEEFLPDREK